MSNQKPELKLREGRVELSIWKNKFTGEDGTEHDSYMFSPNKLKQKEDGSIERTSYFTRSDLKNLNLLINEALDRQKCIEYKMRIKLRPEELVLEDYQFLFSLFLSTLNFQDLYYYKINNKETYDND